MPAYSRPTAYALTLFFSDKSTNLSVKLISGDKFVVLSETSPLFVAFKKRLWIFLLSTTIVL